MTVAKQFNAEFETALAGLADSHTAIASAQFVLAGKYQALLSLVRAGVAIPGSVMAPILTGNVAPALTVSQPTITPVTPAPSIPKSERTASSRVTHPAPAKSERKASTRKSGSKRSAGQTVEDFRKGLENGTAIHVVSGTYTGPATWTRSWRGSEGKDARVVKPDGEAIRVPNTDIFPPGAVVPTAVAQSNPTPAPEASPAPTAVAEPAPESEPTTATPELKVLPGADSELDRLAAKRARAGDVPSPQPQDVKAPVEAKSKKDKVEEVIRSLNPSDKNPVSVKTISERSGLSVMEVFQSVQELHKADVIHVDGSARIDGVKPAAAILAGVLPTGAADSGDW